MNLRVNEPAVVFQELDGEVVLVNLEDGNYYSLNEAGSHILVSLEAGTPADELTSCFAFTSEEERQSALAHVDSFLKQLREEKLVVEGDPKKTDEQSAEPKAFEVPTVDKFTDMQDFLLLDPIHEVGDQGWPGQ